MAIARFENLDINNLTFGLSDIGEQTTIQTKWFTTRGRVSSVANSLNILEKYRLYQDLINFTLNYTPNMKQIIDCLLYTSPSPRDRTRSRMPSSA